MSIRGILATVTAVAVIGGVISFVPTRSAADGDPHWKEVTVVYNTDVKGKIEPCG